MDPADLTQRSVMVRVAIVDDHPIARYGVKQVLARMDGLQVVASAASPSELADHMPGTDERPDVVILDLYYGGDAPCLEAIGQLGTAARVLVMSASGRPADVLGAIRAGAAGYITKQADGLMFAAAVEAVARGGFWLSAELADIVHAELSRPPRQDPHPARPRRLTADDLSPREQETLTLIASGFTYSQVATRMGISKATVDTYIERIRGKLQVGNKAELIRAALERLAQPNPS